MPGKIDLLYKTFGRLTVKSEALRKGKQFAWNCECSCGNQIILSTASLRTGTKSCGCLQKEVVTKQGKKNFKGTGIAGTNSLFTRYKRGAKHRELEFQLSKEEFTFLINQECHYCGNEPQSTWRREEVNQALIYNGIDRVDNKKGYLTTNVVSCCKVCNKAKGIMDYQEFLYMAKRISERNR